MKYFLIATLLIFLFTVCNKTEKLTVYDYVSNESYENGLKVKGREFDGLIIEDCTFSGKSLSIGEVENVLIKNCVFENINGNGVEIGFTGLASNITIESCTFKNIGSNGIDSHENAPNCTITNCYFENIGLSDIGAALGQPHHGIYWKGKSVTISGNKFINGKQNKGNAISIRSSGKIISNTIHDAAKNGIMYYSNHPGGDSLFIENNFIINSTEFSIISGSDGNVSNHNKNVIIRFNSMVQTENESIYISDKFENSTNFEIYGNIIVNPTGTFYKIFNNSINSYSNLESTDDIGFKNMTAGDLHINESSEANGFCSGLTVFPTTDIDDENRVSNSLDAGADEIN